MKISNFLMLVTLSFLVSFCSKPKEITEENVAHIIQTLSSDDMKGRHAFKSEIHDAADFIAGKFSEIGLQTLPNEDDFKQEFSVYTIKPSEVQISINGKEIQNENYFGLLKSEHLIWDQNNTDLQSITQDDTFRDRFRKLTSDNKSSLISVSEKHKKWFHRYRSFFSRFNRTSELNTKPTDIFVLNDEKVNGLELNWKNNVHEINLSNIVGVVKGNRADEIVLFSAHYDHIGVVNPTEQDSIANGANDNASGVSGVIELARHFESGPTPERTLYFVAFSAEEVGGYGAQHFSRSINPDEIVTMINLEMIGKPAVEGPNSAWITGYNYSDVGEILKNNTNEQQFEFYPDPYPKQNLFFRSDNATFAKLGVPAHTISTTPIDVDKDYHRVSDEFKTLDITHTTNTIKAVANATKVIITGERTPSRIDTTALGQNN